MIADESKEMRLFRLYGELCSLDVGRIEERHPPEPDILAVVAGHGIAYELTEAVEPSYARKLSDMLKTHPLVRQAYAPLPSNVRRDLEAKHNGKMIDPCFRDGVSLRDREASLPAIFDLLLTISAFFGSEQLERIEKTRSRY